MSDIFNQDFQEFLQALNDKNVEYLLVGGYATIIHGYNRTTGDLDLWVNQTEENYDKLVMAYRQFKMPVFDMTKTRFLNDPDVDVFTFGRPPVSIDIITKLKGLNFNEAYANAEMREIGNDLIVKVIRLNDLITAKKASNRPKDQDDIEHLT
jgi:predicted nucleotidyltransferase